MNEHEQQHESQRELAEYLATHDTWCPKCGYNLRQTQNSICSECGLELTQIPLKHLPTIYFDAQFEKHVIRLAMCCVLVVCSPVLLLILSTGKGEYAIIAVALYLMIVVACVSVERTTHTRHIRKAETIHYDGTTPFGTYSLLIIATLVIPAIVMIVHIIDSLIT